MSLPIVFITVILTRTEVERRWPGGLTAFKANSPVCREDAQILSLASLSGGDTQDFLDRLADYAFPPEQIAVLDLLRGWLEKVDWLEIVMVGCHAVCWHVGDEPAGAEPWRSPLVG